MAINGKDSWSGDAEGTALIGGQEVTGRIGLAISAANPKVVMAVVQSYEGGSGQLTDLRSKSGGVFRSAVEGGADVMGRGSGGREGAGPRR